MKAVIWDLDDTLWHGTIYHNDKVTLKDETKEVLKQLNKLGIIQIVCTHNKEENAISTLSSLVDINVFEAVFASVNEEKDVMIARILEAYNLNPSEVLFIDDLPYNRMLVKEKLGVHVDYMEDLYEVMKYFDTDRLILMKEQRCRITAEEEWVGNKKEFLKKIRNEIRIFYPSEENVVRLSNLANRTNELNAVRNRYSESEIETFIKDDRYIVYAAELKDNFGDYGIVGEVIIERMPDCAFIKDICVSCRTMGRGVGKELLKKVKKDLHEEGITVRGAVILNEDNFRMPNLFESAGFIKTNETDDKIFYEAKYKEVIQ